MTITPHTPPPVPDLLEADLSVLVASCTGLVLHGRDPAVTSLLGPTHRPDALVVAHCTHDVAAACRFAQRVGVPLRALGEGRLARRPVTGGLVVSTRDLTSATAVAGHLRLGAGAAWAVSGLVVPDPTASVAAGLVFGWPVARAAVDQVHAIDPSDARTRVLLVPPDAVDGLVVVAADLTPSADRLPPR